MTRILKTSLKTREHIFLILYMPLQLHMTLKKHHLHYTYLYVTCNTFGRVVPAQIHLYILAVY